MDSVLRAAPGTPTGVAAITVDGRDGANTIIVVPGANGARPRQRSEEAL